MGVHDAVIGVVSGYAWPKVSVWVNSLNKSGFEGTKVLLSYDKGLLDADALCKRGVHVYEIERENPKVHVDRFEDLAAFLEHRSDPYRYVVFTDVRDVVFQSDPTVGLEERLHIHTLLVCGESMRYRDQEWATNTMREAYPPCWSSVKDRIIINCGVIAGEHVALSNLCRNTWALAQKAQARLADQQALNLLLMAPPYVNTTKVLCSADAWVAHLGTHPDAIGGPDQSLLTELPPVMDTGNGEVWDCALEKKYAIVHQYERMCSIRERIWKKYWEA